MFENYFKKSENYILLVFRLVFGLLFLGHGLMKFGLLGGKATPFLSLFWFAGLIEVVVGIAVAVGFMIRYMGILGAVEMVAAFFIAHFPKGINPYANGGEMAILYFGALLAMVATGSGKYSVDAAIKKKK